MHTNPTVIAGGVTATSATMRFEAQRAGKDVSFVRPGIPFTSPQRLADRLSSQSFFSAKMYKKFIYT